MIYMDNAATSLQKPLQVEQAVLEALRTAGNPGRGAHEATLHASRLVYGARAAAAELFDAEDGVADCLYGKRNGGAEHSHFRLIRPGDHVITTVCEHNSCCALFTVCVIRERRLVLWVWWRVEI